MTSSNLRLNWTEIICVTISNSPEGRLVVQDLLEAMCDRFPIIREWATGNDWEARVKNRIKSTLSIKGHLFIKVSKPNNTNKKGCWWTLSREAEEACQAGRISEYLRGGSRSFSNTHFAGENISLFQTPTPDPTSVDVDSLRMKECGGQQGICIPFELQIA
ncbi:hypothetical protein MVES_001082 [Malassezia vespertilionis]|uniref:Fork-head domain-containing protein n=1 Tax=Malassezia vespertilionis TaxID=2020962 RepID=A0A2N1JDX6_9BASI|nr:hypothetical protein MVES_001082 [Malassezia vespertilionis]